MATSSTRQSELQNSNPSIRRSTGRRKPKGGAADSKKNKKPQRGMGVAKLERLRLQDPEITDQQPAAGFLTFTNPVHFPYSTAYPGFQQDHHRLLHNHLHVFGMNDSDSFLPKNCNVIAGNVVKCYSLHCNICHKKKKIINGENIGVKSEMCETGNDQNMMMVMNQDSMHNLGAKSPQSVGNYGNKVDVVAVHRKGSSNSNWDAAGGNRNRVLMEYDFFPVAKSGGDGGELAWMKKQPAGFEASNCVDLSLKLSYYD